MTSLVFEIVSSFVTWLLVVLGWLVISDQNEYRDAAREAHQRLQVLRSTLIEIEKLAIQHHTNGFCDELVRDLLRKLGDFSYEVSQLRNRKYVGIGVTHSIIDFRTAITGSNMDESSYQRLAVQSSIIDRIEQTRASIDRDLLGYSYKVLNSPDTLFTSLGRILRQRVF